MLLWHLRLNLTADNPSLGSDFLSIRQNNGFAQQLLSSWALYPALLLVLATVIQRPSQITPNSYLHLEMKQVGLCTH
jgi:hypothetical protein